jgi:hypothetical protein
MNDRVYIGMYACMPPTLSLCSSTFQIRNWCNLEHAVSTTNQSMVGRQQQRQQNVVSITYLSIYMMERTNRIPFTFHDTNHSLFVQEAVYVVMYVCLCRYVCMKNVT